MPTPDEITSWKQQRGMIKAACTRTKNYVESIQNVSELVRAHLEERKAKLEIHWSEYDVIQRKLEGFDEAAEEGDRVLFEAAFYALSAKIRTLLNPPAVEHPPTALAASLLQSTASAADISDQLTHIRLPKLDLPTFSGNYQDWFPFYEVFQSVIDRNNSLNNTQRFQYLGAALTGEAADVIHSLEISDQNYPIAWELLRARYENERVIVHAHIRAILDMPGVGKENATDLRRIADGTSKHLRALRSLKRPAEYWDDLLVYILSSKLDTVTARDWQSSISGTLLPTLKQFLDFITHRCLILETSNKKSTPTMVSARAHANYKHQASSHVATFDRDCNYCKGEHSLYFCKEFVKLPVEQRIAEVRKRQLCTNCMRNSNHRSSKCPSGVCRTCGGKHNTLLHLATRHTDTRDKHNTIAATNTSLEPASTTISAHSSVSQNHGYVALSTATIYTYHKLGLKSSCRALLDCGSQANFISRKHLESLQLKPRRQYISVCGVNQGTSIANQIVSVKIRSRINSFETTIECIVTDKITDKLPAISLQRSDIKIPQTIRLADPQFHKSSDIDLLIGAELFWQLICVGNIKATAEHPTLQKTQFGWIIAGRIPTQNKKDRNVRSFHVSIRDTRLHDELRRFWEVEEMPGNLNSLSTNERKCEQHFLDNVSRDAGGRFVVKLPIKEPISPPLGQSRPIAMRRFYNLEKRLARDRELKNEYTRFINEYIALGHMKFVNADDDSDDLVCFYLPHHCVIKQSSQTTKLRVVFDGSCKTTSGTSLNDVLMVGPVVQQDLISIILRFRTHAYVFVADIKMYRQVLVHESQTSLQRILWRENIYDDVNTYELTTVTYGTSSASYLATRCLNYLAEQEASNFPRGSQHVIRDFYVDDILTGSDSIEEAKLIQLEIVQLLRKGSFEFRKWASNSLELLESIQGQTNGDLIDFNKNDDSRVLGIQWSPQGDSFHFLVEAYNTSNNITKRSLLSDIARLFDPLGLIGPVLVVAKLIIQEIWQLQLDWDASLPAYMHTRWFELRNQLSLLNDLSIPRRVKFNSKIENVQVHGFSDASQNAYGACIYVRSEIGNNNYRIELLCSKSRVAPLKTISLPRLELCAAVLLAQLFDRVNRAIDLSQARKFLWTDSSITLNWISSCSRKWSVFVSNRVGEIQTLTDTADWRHVSSANNPVDILSRGSNPSDLIISDLWWHGPTYLKNHEASWPNLDIPHLTGDLPEARRVIAIPCAVKCSSINELLDKFSSIAKICRIIAYCLRFANSVKNKEENSSWFVTHDEVSGALHALCKFVQSNAFPLEIRQLSKGEPISSSSNILSLSPFLDEEGLIRVGGRLRNTNIPYETRHPILLPKRHRITDLIIEAEHIRSLHAGVQLTMAAVRQHYWPLSMRSTVRKIIRSCVTCFKAKPSVSEAVMGDLPHKRVTPSRPFTHCGVDYAGPILIREGKRRNARNTKAYIAIFVCFATKAIHVELVTDLTSDAFLGALKRFLARRGNVNTIHSDNGTSFTGASRQLSEFYDFLKEEKLNSPVREYLGRYKISWQFIPPCAPHFGGLWEAAVKSTKYHLHRVIGNAHLTYEELQTVLCEIEAILNSRPLTPLSEDPNDFTYLTPGHFLVGEALNSLPYPDLTDINDNRLSRWQKVEQLRQHFWRRWSREYLSQLQERFRWKQKKGAQLEVGQLAVIRQPGLSPLLWSMGRIQEIHPSSDGIVRSATIRTNKGTFVRPLAKLSILSFNCKP